MADISSIVLPNDATMYNIKDSAARLRATTAIGYCTTAAGAKDKVVTLDPSTASSWSLEVGAMISVVFLNTSTYDGTYDVTLNVNSTGAYPVVSSETISNVTSSGISRSAMGAGRVPRGYRGPEGEQYTTSTYIFNGAYWICISCDKSTYVSDSLAMTPHLAFAECNTAAGTKDKVATITGTPYYCSEWNLSVGAMVFVKFANTNTYSATAANHITLNVNGTGAYDIYYGASNANTGTNTTAYGYKNYINCYVFDGDYWVFAGRNLDSNTTYSSMTEAEITAGTGTSVRLITPERLNIACFGPGTALSSDDDLNDPSVISVTIGNRYYGSSTQICNSVKHRPDYPHPTRTVFMIETKVTNKTTSGTRLLMTMYARNTETIETSIFYRSFDGTNWGSWKQVVDTVIADNT